MVHLSKCDITKIKKLFKLKRIKFWAARRCKISNFLQKQLSFLDYSIKVIKSYISRIAEYIAEVSKGNKFFVSFKKHLILV